MVNIGTFISSKLVKLKPFILTDLGFENMQDWTEACMGAKFKVLSLISFLSFASISGFIERNMWQDPQEIYFLITLIGIDLFTGVWKSIKNGKTDPTKKFRSRRISRTVGKSITYAIMLYMAFNMDKSMHAAFFWMPYGFLGMFYATEAWSIIENLSELGFLSKDMIKVLKEKLSITTNKRDEKPTDKKNGNE